ASRPLSPVVEVTALEVPVLVLSPCPVVSTRLPDVVTPVSGSIDAEVTSPADDAAPPEASFSGPSLDSASPDGAPPDEASPDPADPGEVPHAAVAATKPMSKVERIILSSRLSARG